jgi:hypothetical protein
MISADAARNVVGIIGKLVRFDWDLLVGAIQVSKLRIDRRRALGFGWFG